jgi:hypothetical protein
MRRSLLTGSRKRTSAGSPAGTNWYYHGIVVALFNTYYQAFLCQALMDLGDIWI